MDVRKKVQVQTNILQKQLSIDDRQSSSQPTSWCLALGSGSYMGWYFTRTLEEGRKVSSCLTSRKFQPTNGTILQLTTQLKGTTAIHSHLAAFQHIVSQRNEYINFLIPSNSWYELRKNWTLTLPCLWYIIIVTDMFAQSFCGQGMSGTNNKYIYILSAQLRLYWGIYKWRQNIMCLGADQFAFIYLCLMTCFRICWI